jgi:hypothetical protein
MSAPPIYDAIKTLLVARGWRIDPAAKERADGELHEFLHPDTGEAMAYVDAVHAEEERDHAGWAPSVPSSSGSSMVLGLEQTIEELRRLVAISRPCIVALEEAEKERDELRERIAELEALLAEERDA